MPPEGLWMQTLGIYILSYIKLKGNIRSFLCITEHHTVKLYEKMPTGLHAFQTGRYEHDELFLILIPVCKEAG